MAKSFSHLFFLLVLSILSLPKDTLSQNVGIGTISPAYKLDVKNGSINTDSLYRIKSYPVLQITDTKNLFIGRGAGLANDGNNNVFVGYSAGITNSTGSDNCFFGSEASFYNTSGSFNVTIGFEAGHRNVTSNFNSILGAHAGYYNTGSSNSFIGTIAGYNNTSGSNNSFMGYLAGYNNYTGSNLTLLGTSANSLSADLSYATAIGSHALVGCNNCLALGGITSNGDQTRVGINNPNPATDLHIIQQSTANSDNSRGIRLQSPGGNQWRVFLDPSNNYVFQYNNNVFAYIEPVNGNFISSSDVRLKKDITSMDEVLDKLLLLQPKTYHYTANSDVNRYSWGFLAQDVEKLFPDFVFSSENGMKGIAYSNFSVIAVKAIQEQQQLIEDQKQKIGHLEQQMEEVLKELSEMRSKKN